jgi:hypothetical protein
MSVMRHLLRCLGMATVGATPSGNQAAVFYRLLRAGATGYGFRLLSTAESDGKILCASGSRISHLGDVDGEAAIGRSVAYLRGVLRGVASRGFYTIRAICCLQYLDYGRAWIVTQPIEDKKRRPEGPDDDRETDNNP